MTKQSAGILLYRIHSGELQLFLVHPGGPFFRNKDDGAWSIPKGEFDADEDGLAAARREFEEETSQQVDGQFIALKSIRQKAGKVVHAWAVEGDIEADKIVSNVFEMEWPPRSGKKVAFPEIDRAGWFNVETARLKMNAAQVGLLEELIDHLNRD